MARHNNHRNSFSDQVRLLASQVKTRQIQLPRISDIGYDGQHHINIWEEGETILGRALSHMANLPFTHSTLGAFASIEGLWYYVQAETPDESLRTKSGFVALSAGRKVKTKPVIDFRIIIANANWEKVNAYPDIMQMVMDCNLHFEKYYYKVDPSNNSNTAARTVHSPWIIAMFDEIRYALLNNTQPDFDFLSDTEQQRIQTAFRSQGSNSDLFNQFKSNQPSPVFPTAKAEQEVQFNKPLKKKKWPKKERIVGMEVDVVQLNQPDVIETEKQNLLSQIESRSSQLDALANLEGVVIAVDIASTDDSSSTVSYEDIRKVTNEQSASNNGADVNESLVPVISEQPVTSTEDVSN